MNKENLNSNELQTLKQLEKEHANSNVPFYYIFPCGECYYNNAFICSNQSKEDIEKKADEIKKQYNKEFNLLEKIDLIKEDENKSTIKSKYFDLSTCKSVTPDKMSEPQHFIYTKLIELKEKFNSKGLEKYSVNSTSLLNNTSFIFIDDEKFFNDNQVLSVLSIASVLKFLSGKDKLYLGFTVSNKGNFNIVRIANDKQEFNNFYHIEKKQKKQETETETEATGTGTGTEKNEKVASDEKPKFKNVEQLINKMYDIFESSATLKNKMNSLEKLVDYNRK